MILKVQCGFKSEAHNAYTEEIKKIALSSNDDKRLQTFDKIKSYPYGANVGKVCKTELLNAISNIKRLILMMLQMKIKHNTLDKKWSFLLNDCSLNMTKSAASCLFGHIYWIKA